MNDKRPGSTDKTDSAAAREARLKEALRANLRRRKSQSKARKTGKASEKDGQH
ncbi:MAG: hypothetical protein AAFR93_14470 [Pseudomonadota bacterium]